MLLAALAAAGCNSTRRPAQDPPAEPLPAVAIDAAGTRWRPEPVEPLAYVTFDPYECEPGMRLGGGLASVGVSVRGAQGDRCAFVLERIEALKPEVRVTVATCSVARAGDVVRIPWGLDDLHLAGAECDVARGLSADEAAARTPRAERTRHVRFWDPPGEQPEAIGTSPRLELTYRVWPPFPRRPALDQLDAAGLPARTIVLDASNRAWPAPFWAVRGRDLHPRRFRLSVPVEQAGVLRAAAAGPEGRYYAAEVEVTSMVPPPPPRPTTGPITFDASTCAKDRHHRFIGIGSLTVEVIGPDGDACVYIGTPELEASYERLECRVPRSTGVVTIEIGDEPRTLPGTCTSLGHGDLITDELNMAAKTRRRGDVTALPGTSFTVRYHTLAPGRGAAIEEAVPVRVRVSAWGPAPQPDVLEAPTGAPLLDGRELQVVLGRPTYGLALDTVLREPGLARGGARRYAVRTEVLGAFAPLLGDVELRPEQLITVELHVLDD